MGKKSEKKNSRENSLTIQKKQILIVDDHPLYRKGLTEYINEEHDFNVCGEASDSTEAMEAIKNLKPDAVTLDISLQGPNGVDVVKSIKARYGELPVLIVSMHDESLYAERVLRAGAKGYVMKSEAADKILTALRRILKGQIYLSESMTDKMLEKQVRGIPKDVSSVESLSDRELEVFQLIGQGETTNNIAKKLHLSVKTVETYRANIKNKLNLSNS
ncbi:MAG: response regulator transcription factor, partial [Candidatus Omnitrophica bacterium]|nr:response regulator transcription factor [Candidatus Omnitrophota bacterium]